MVLVLGGGRGSDQGRIDDGASGELHAVGQQHLAYLGKQRVADLVLFEQVTELQQDRRTRHPPKVDSADVAKCGDVVKRVFTGFVGKVEPVGHEVHAQHPLQAHGGRPLPAFG